MYVFMYVCMYVCMNVCMVVRGIPASLLRPSFDGDDRSFLAIGSVSSVNTQLNSMYVCMNVCMYVGRYIHMHA
jgi:hypothetical protein